MCRNVPVTTKPGSLTLKKRFLADGQSKGCRFVMLTEDIPILFFVSACFFFRLWLKQYYRGVPGHHKTALFTLVSKAMGAEDLIGTKGIRYYGS